MQGKQTSHHQWTSQELMLLGMGLRKYQHDWRRISEEFLPHLNPISIKNKFYKRPAEIADVIAELGLQRDQVDKHQPTLSDLRLIETRLQRELHEIQQCIARAIRQQQTSQTQPQPQTQGAPVAQIQAPTLQMPQFPQIYQVYQTQPATSPQLSATRPSQPAITSAALQIRQGIPVVQQVQPAETPAAPPQRQQTQDRAGTDFQVQLVSQTIQSIANLRQPNPSFPDFCASTEWSAQDKARVTEWRANEKNVAAAAVDLRDEDRIASLLDNYSQYFAGFLSPQNSFEDLHK